MSIDHKQFKTGRLTNCWRHVTCGDNTIKQSIGVKNGFNVTQSWDTDQICVESDQQIGQKGMVQHIELQLIVMKKGCTWSKSKLGAISRKQTGIALANHTAMGSHAPNSLMHAAAALLF